MSNTGNVGRHWVDYAFNGKEWFKVYYITQKDKIYNQPLLTKVFCEAVNHNEDLEIAKKVINNSNLDLECYKVEKV